MTVGVYNPESAAVKLEPSIARLKERSKEICTAWKLDEYQWATAWHCVAMTGRKYTIKTQPYGDRDYGITLDVKSLLLPAEKADDKDHWEDWAVINTRDETPEIPALAVDCAYDIKMGEQVAYMGFPSIANTGLGQHFSTGIVNAVEEHKKRPWHFLAQITGGPGASGSPVISLKTGDVIGYVTRGVGSRGNLLGVGMESVAGMDMCDDVTDAPVSSSSGGKGRLPGDYGPF